MLSQTFGIVTGFFAFIEVIGPSFVTTVAFLSNACEITHGSARDPRVVENHQLELNAFIIVFVLLVTHFVAFRDIALKANL